MIDNDVAHTHFPPSILCSYAFFFFLVPLLDTLTVETFISSWGDSPQYLLTFLCCERRMPKSHFPGHVPYQEYGCTPGTRDSWEHMHQGSILTTFHLNCDQNGVEDFSTLSPIAQHPCGQHLALETARSA